MSDVKNASLCVHDVTGLVRKSDPCRNEDEYNKLIEIVENWTKFKCLSIVSCGVKYSYNTNNIVTVWLE